jgi:NAD(P)-dependent dehydrogenase (short-subunit alcohol dehydrogenase family)
MRPIEQSTVLVTGATDGLGRRVARDLAAGGATVIVHGRSRERAERAVAEIVEETGNSEASLVLGDLASLAEVRDLSERVRARTDRLDVLVNNAGIGAGPRGGGDRRELSADGHELRFAVNYLSQFLLTHLLLDLLRASAPARIVNVASVGQAPIDFEDVMLERGYDGFRAYAQSKLAQIMFTFELAERLGEASGVTVNALHPATLMDTKMVVESFGSARSSVEEGARATERLIADPALDGITGRYFDGTHESRAHPQAYDAEARRQLWELSERLTGLGSR